MAPKDGPVVDVGMEHMFELIERAADACLSSLSHRSAYFNNEDAFRDAVANEISYMRPDFRVFCEAPMWRNRKGWTSRYGGRADILIQMEPSCYFVLELKYYKQGVFKCRRDAEYKLYPQNQQAQIWPDEEFWSPTMRSVSRAYADAIGVVA
jgi:hypothetical protein